MLSFSQDDLVTLPLDNVQNTQAFHTLIGDGFLLSSRYSTILTPSRGNEDDGAVQCAIDSKHLGSAVLTSLTITNAPSRLDHFIHVSIDLCEFCEQCSP